MLRVVAAHARPHPIADLAAFAELLRWHGLHHSVDASLTGAHHRVARRRCDTLAGRIARHLGAWVAVVCAIRSVDTSRPRRSTSADVAGPRQALAVLVTIT